MVTLSKAQIDQLLRESEQRLQRSSRTDSKSILAEPSQAEASIQTFSTNKKENLAVREVIPAQSFLSEGTRKVCITSNLNEISSFMQYFLSDEVQPFVALLTWRQASVLDIVL